jgi:hypothetical protein
MCLSSWLRRDHSLAVPSKPEEGCYTRRLLNRASPFRLSVEQLDDRVVPSTFTVKNLADSGADSLRAAVIAANSNPGNDVIKFTGGLHGTVVLTSGELVLTDGLRIGGPGANRLVVSGNDASRVFQIGSGVPVGIDGLTVAHGHAAGQGGGIFNAGILTVSDSILSDNTAVGISGTTLGAVVDAFGGGIFNTGTLAVGHTRFVHNQSIGADGISSTIGSSAIGGAISSVGTPTAPSAAKVSHSTFLGNQAIGGAAGIGASRAGLGGAIQNSAGAFTVSDSLFQDNRAIGGLDNGVPGGFGTGVGGAIANVARAGSALLVVSHSTMTNNQAVGGAAGAGPIGQDGRGGAIVNYIFGGVPLPVTVTATAHVDHSTLFGNEAVGGAGPTSGNGQGGGIANLNGGVLTVSDSVIARNRAIGGAGVGNGGNGQGGGIFNDGPTPVGTPNLSLRRSLVVLNRADGGAAGSGGSAGLGQGGGLFIAPGGLASGDAWTRVFANDASSSDDNVFGTLT